MILYLLKKDMYLWKVEIDTFILPLLKIYRNSFVFFFKLMKKVLTLNFMLHFKLTVIL